jgi:DNA polymerase-3 subunit gamma/tau
MGHLVLARKYRPQNFDQVIGQDSVVDTLKAAISSGRFAHAYLFTGSRGVGKTTIARIVAKAMVCTDRKGPNPCCACSQCKGIDDFSSLDVLEIDGASHTGVDDIREIREIARFQPASAKYKIFIIDEVHMLSINAFNALLKILEEPPPHIVFMFATTESHKLPKTILSRCQRYDFRRVEISQMVGALKNVATLENRTISEDGLLLLAQSADGGMRDALSMMEQVFSADLPKYTADDIAQLLGLVSQRSVNQLVQAVIEADALLALSISKSVYDSGLDLCQLIDAMAERIRVLSLATHFEHFSQVSRLSLTLDESDFAYAKAQSPEDLRRLFAMATDGLAQVFSSRKPLFAAEVLILRLALRPALKEAAQINFYLNKLDAILRNRPLPAEPTKPAPAVSAVAVPPPPPPPPEAIKPAPLKPVVLEIPKPNPQLEPLQALALIIKNLEDAKESWASHLRHARPRVFQQKLELIFEQTLHFDRVKNSHTATLEKFVKAVLGPNFATELTLIKMPEPEQKIAPTVAEAEVKAEEQSRAELYQEAAEHPVVKQVLEVFGGEITKVERLPLLPLV